MPSRGVDGARFPLAASPRGHMNGDSAVKIHEERPRQGHGLSNFIGRGRPDSAEQLLDVPPEVTVHTSSPAVDLLYALYFYLA